AGILLFAGFGAYANKFNYLEVIILLVLGVVGFFMRRYGYPVAPLVIGMILGPMAEEQLRKSLMISQGDPTYLVTSPFAIGAYASRALVMIAGLWLRRRQAKLEERLAAEDLATREREAITIDAQVTEGAHRSGPQED